MSSFSPSSPGPPDTPCCLAMVVVNRTAVSLALSFTSNFAGGSPQTFTIEKRISGENDWVIAVKDIADPGFGNNVTQKISDLYSDTSYKFQVKATNADGDSGYSKAVEAKTDGNLLFSESLFITLSAPKFHP